MNFILNESKVYEICSDISRERLRKYKSFFCTRSEINNVSLAFYE